MKGRGRSGRNRETEKALKNLDCAPDCNRYHTRAEAAAILGVHPDTIFDLERRGLRVSRKTEAIRILHSWINEFMRNG